MSWLSNILEKTGLFGNSGTSGSGGKGDTSKYGYNDFKNYQKWVDSIGADGANTDYDPRAWYYARPKATDFDKQMGTHGVERLTGSFDRMPAYYEGLFSKYGDKNFNYDPSKGGMNFAINQFDRKLRLNWGNEGGATAKATLRDYMNYDMAARFAQVGPYAQDADFFAEDPLSAWNFRAVSEQKGASEVLQQWTHPSYSSTYSGKRDKHEGVNWEEYYKNKNPNWEGNPWDVSGLQAAGSTAYGNQVAGFEKKDFTWQGDIDPYTYQNLLYAATGKFQNIRGRKMGGGGAAWEGSYDPSQTWENWGETWGPDWVTPEMKEILADRAYMESQGMEQGSGETRVGAYEDEAEWGKGKWADYWSDPEQVIPFDIRDQYEDVYGYMENSPVRGHVPFATLQMMMPGVDWSYVNPNVRKNDLTSTGERLGEREDSLSRLMRIHDVGDRLSEYIDFQTMDDTQAFGHYYFGSEPGWFNQILPEDVNLPNTWKNKNYSGSAKGSRVGYGDDFSSWVGNLSDPSNTQLQNIQKADDYTARDPWKREIANPISGSQYPKSTYEQLLSEGGEYIPRHGTENFPIYGPGDYIWSGVDEYGRAGEWGSETARLGEYLSGDMSAEDYQNLNMLEKFGDTGSQYWKSAREAVYDLRNFGDLSEEKLDERLDFIAGVWSPENQYGLLSTQDKQNQAAYTMFKSWGRNRWTEESARLEAQRQAIAQQQAAQQFQNAGFLNPEGDTDIDFNPFEWQPTRAWNSATGEWEVQPNQNARWNFHWNRWEDSGDQASWEGFNDWIENKSANENYRFNHLSDRFRYINPEFLTEKNTRGFLEQMGDKGWERRYDEFGEHVGFKQDFGVFDELIDSGLVDKKDVDEDYLLNLKRRLEDGELDIGAMSLGELKQTLGRAGLTGVMGGKYSVEQKYGIVDDLLSRQRARGLQGGERPEEYAYDILGRKGASQEELNRIAGLVERAEAANWGGKPGEYGKYHTQYGAQKWQDWKTHFKRDVNPRWMDKDAVKSFLGGHFESSWGGNFSRLGHFIGRSTRADSPIVTAGYMTKEELAEASWDDVWDRMMETEEGARLMDSTFRGEYGYGPYNYNYLGPGGSLGAGEEGYDDTTYSFLEEFKANQAIEDWNRKQIELGVVNEARPEDYLYETGASDADRSWIENLFKQGNVEGWETKPGPYVKSRHFNPNHGYSTTGMNTWFNQFTADVDPRHLTRQDAKDFMGAIYNKRGYDDWGQGDWDDVFEEMMSTQEGARAIDQKMYDIFSRGGEFEDYAKGALWHEEYNFGGRNIDTSGHEIYSFLEEFETKQAQEEWDKRRVGKKGFLDLDDAIYNAPDSDTIRAWMNQGDSKAATFARQEYSKNKEEYDRRFSELDDEVAGGRNELRSIFAELGWDRRFLPTIDDYDYVGQLSNKPGGFYENQEHAWDPYKRRWHAEDQDEYHSLEEIMRSGTATEEDYRKFMSRNTIGQIGLPGERNWLGAQDITQEQQEKALAHVRRNEQLGERELFYNEDVDRWVGRDFVDYSDKKNFSSIDEALRTGTYDEITEWSGRKGNEDVRNEILTRPDVQKRLEELKTEQEESSWENRFFGEDSIKYWEPLEDPGYAQLGETDLSEPEVELTEEQKEIYGDKTGQDLVNRVNKLYANENYTYEDIPESVVTNIISDFTDPEFMQALSEEEDDTKRKEVFQRILDGKLYGQLNVEVGENTGFLPGPGETETEVETLITDSESTEETTGPIDIGEIMGEMEETKEITSNEMASMETMSERYPAYKNDLEDLGRQATKLGVDPWELFYEMIDVKNEKAPDGTIVQVYNKKPELLGGSHWGEDVVKWADRWTDEWLEKSREQTFQVPLPEFTGIDDGESPLTIPIDPTGPQPTEEELEKETKEKEGGLLSEKGETDFSTGLLEGSLEELIKEFFKEEELIYDDEGNLLYIDPNSLIGGDRNVATSDNEKKDLSERLKNVNVGNVDSMLYKEDKGVEGSNEVSQAQRSLLLKEIARLKNQIKKYEPEWSLKEERVGLREGISEMEKLGGITDTAVGKADPWWGKMAQNAMDNQYMTQDRGFYSGLQETARKAQTKGAEEQLMRNMSQAGSSPEEIAYARAQLKKTDTTREDMLKSAAAAQSQRAAQMQAASQFKQQQMGLIERYVTGKANMQAQKDAGYKQISDADYRQMEGLAQLIAGQFGLTEAQMQDIISRDTGRLQKELAEDANNVTLQAAQLSKPDSGGGGCCWIMLEARYGDGTMDLVVRKYRDEHMTDRNKRGYYKFAEVIVPLMRKYKAVHKLIQWTFGDPLVKYGGWYYGDNKWGWVFAPIKSFWMGLFNVIGQETEFIRENGEVV